MLSAARSKVTLVGNLRSVFARPWCSHDQFLVPKISRYNALCRSYRLGFFGIMCRPADELEQCVLDAVTHLHVPSFDSTQSIAGWHG